MNIKRIMLPVCCILILSNKGLAQQRIDFPVSNGDRELAMPWTGGYNAPQFSNIDLNRDGITDMISFDRQGNILRAFVRMPASGRWVQSWDHEKFFPPLVDWVLVVDFDGDGVEDLFTSSSPTGVGGTTVYKGAYNNDVWSFTKLMDRDKDYLQVQSGPGLTNIYISWDDIPSITDVDLDGDIDILAFEPGGSYIYYYQNQSVEMGWGTDSLRYILKDFCWGKILENELNEEVYLSDDPDICSDGFIGVDPILPRHSGSTIMTLDMDFDSDKDAFLGDISSRTLVFLTNGLNSEDAWITDQETPYPIDDVPVDLPYFVAAYSVQLDDDPEPELLAAINSRSLAEDRQSVWRYDEDPLTDGPYEYQLTEKGWLQNEMIDLGSQSRPAFADVNGDELIDMIIGGFHYTETGETRIPSLWYFRNEGTLTWPYFRLASKDYLGMSQYATLPTFDFTPAFGDLDGDDDLDLVVGEQNGKLFYFNNSAAFGDSMLFGAPVYPFMNIAVGVSSSPQIADINGDGLADLVIGERTGNSDNNGRCSNLNYFQNIGSEGNPIFNADVNAAPNTACYGRVLFDIIIGLPQFSTLSIVNTSDGLILMTGMEPGKLNIYGNLQQGITGSLSVLDVDYGNLDIGNRSAPALADLNNDGKFELAVGNARGGIELFSTEILVGTTSVVTPGNLHDKPYTFINVIANNRIEIIWKDVEGKILIFDVYGRAIENYLTGDQSQIDVSQMIPGIYFIQVEVGGKVWVEKVVVGKS